MFPRIELVWLSETAPAARWTRGPVSRSAPTPWALDRLLRQRLPVCDTDGVLFWDPKMGVPDPTNIAEIFQSRGDLWHAGLRLGMAGKPGLLDFVAPEWPLNRDPDAGIEATSWRLSLRACLVRTQILRALGGPDPQFDALELAGLEMGYRYIRLGAIPRHQPSLIAVHPPAHEITGCLPDELRLVALGHGRFWACWALSRALLTRYASTLNVLSCIRGLWRLPGRFARVPLSSTPPRVLCGKPFPLISVILPTLDRYPHLSRLLAQLRKQTVPVSEIIIVDQTPTDRRLPIGVDFPDLPLRVFTRDRPGQCSARNQAITAACGELLLFLDDDDEILPDLVASHLRCLSETDADGCCGAADEPGVDSPPIASRFRRASDVFPTNNSMLRRAALARSGLFDLAFDRGELEDGDLGMRLLQSGAVLVLNPAIRVIHHHAPRGGLRAHGARVVTYTLSRRTLWARRLPATSEIYYLRRYFTCRQMREALWLLVCGTFSVRGGVLKKALKALIATLQLPSTVLRIRFACRRADRLAQMFPQIPRLPELRGEMAGGLSNASEELPQAISA